MKLEDVSKLIDKAMEKAKDKKVLEAIAKDIVKQIVKRVRLGYGVSDDSKPSKQKKLAPLSAGYKEQRRKGLKRSLHSTASPAKSNLTLTGDMLEDLHYEVRDGKIRLYFKKEFSRKKAEWNTEKRPFMQLTTGELEQVTEMVRQAILKEFGKLTI